jgi:polyhydroxyalkanoate synthesis regulator phasin
MKRQAEPNELHEAMDSRFDVLTEVINAGFEHMEERFQKMGADVEVLKSDVGCLKSDVGTLKSDVGTLKYEMREVKGELNSLNRRVGRLEGKTNVLVDVLQGKQVISLTDKQQILAC